MFELQVNHSTSSLEERERLLTLLRESADVVTIVNTTNAVRFWWHNVRSQLGVTELEEWLRSAGFKVDEGLYVFDGKQHQEQEKRHEEHEMLAQ